MAQQRILGILVAALALSAGVAQAQTDLSGGWSLEVSVALPEGEALCEYSGDTTLQQEGTSLSGFAELFLDSGPDECPAEMSAELIGAAVESEKGVFVSGVLAGPLGQTSFTGSISPNPGGEGAFEVSQGPFSGSTGIWVAQLAAVLAVPELTPIGLTVLTLLVLATGSWLLARPSA